MSIAPLPRVTLGLRALLRGYPELTSVTQVGGSLPGEVTELYVRIAQIAGGRQDEIQGDLVYDVEIFHPSFLEAEDAAYSIDALLIGFSGMIRVPGRQSVRFDRVVGNGPPAPTFWDDDEVTRFLATYVITARRQEFAAYEGPAPDDDTELYSGEGPPPSNLPWDVNELYLDLTTGDVYQKEA